MILGLEQLYKTDKIRPVYCYRMNMDHIMKSINQSINKSNNQSIGTLPSN